MTRALVRLYPGRPAFVGGVCISTHDTWYFTEHAKLRTRALQSHPDFWLPNGRHPAKSEWVKHGNAYRRFVAEQREWYAQFKLVPPTRQTFTEAERRWATRVARYGPTGFSKAGRQRIVDSIIDRAKRWQTRRFHYGTTGGVKQPRTHCKKGHAYAEYAFFIKTKRLCRVCYRAAQRRAYYRAKNRQMKAA